MVNILLRRLFKNRLFNLTNFLGLFATLITLLVVVNFYRLHDSYDNHLSEFEKIYRIVLQKDHGDRLEFIQGVPYPLGNALSNEYPDLEGVAMIEFIRESMISNEESESKVIADGIVFAEIPVLGMLDISSLAGDLSSFEEPNSIIIDSNLAKRLFNIKGKGYDNCVGSIVKLQGKLPLKVLAVIEPLKNDKTEFPFSALISYSSLQSFDPYYISEKESFSSINSQTGCFVLLNEETNSEYYQNQSSNFSKKYFGVEEGVATEIVWQDLEQIHKSDDWNNYSGYSFSRRTQTGLLILSSILLIITIANTTNISITKTKKNSRLIGLRKVLGARRRDLIRLESIEMFTVLFLAFVASSVSFNFLQPILEGFLHLKLETWSLVDYILPGFLIIAVVLVTSLLYPLLYIFRITPDAVVKNGLFISQKRTESWFRNLLTFSQISMSIFMIFMSLVIYKQNSYLENTDLGFEVNNIFNVWLPNNDPLLTDRFDTELSKKSDVISISLSSGPPLSMSNLYADILIPTLAQKINQATFKAVDESYFKLFDLEISGQNLTRNSGQEVLINEKLAKTLNTNDPYNSIGQTLRTGWGDKKIVGVVENFHNNNLREKIDYVVFFSDPTEFGICSILLKKGHKDLSTINEAYNKIWPNSLLSGLFYDDEVTSYYSEEQSVSNLLLLLTIVILIISILGLYSLTLHNVYKKEKEIAIRKIHGAYNDSILWILTKEMLIISIVALISVSILGYYIGNKWLLNYSYRIEIGLQDFVILIVIVIGTISVSTIIPFIKSQYIEPIDILREEG